MIFHVFGGQLAGKTTVIKKLDPTVFAHWDIVEDFYVKHKIIKNNKMDWDIWQMKHNLIERDIKQFVKDNKDKHIVIESSGRNKEINRVIKQLGEITPVYMGVPTQEETTQRAKNKKDVDLKSAKQLNLSTGFKFKAIASRLPGILTIDEAYEFILNQTKEKETNNTNNRDMFDTLTE